MSEKRLFVGLGFSEEFKNSLEPWIKKIRKTSDRKDISLRWAPPLNYHVTLVFLGNTKEENIPNIEFKIHQVAQRHAPFQLKVRNMSGFPTLTQARVLYLGVQRSQALLDLQADLEGELLPADLAEADYSPHLTLARLRNPKNCKDLLSPFEHIDLGKQPVLSLNLYQSVLSHGFPVYLRLSQFELAGESVGVAE